VPLKPNELTPAKRVPRERHGVSRVGISTGMLRQST
jgi:hypothetical protein